MALERFLELITQANSELDKSTGVLGGFENVVGAATKKVEGLSEYLIGLGNSAKVFDDLYKAASDSTNSIESLSGAVVKLEALSSRGLISGVAVGSIKALSDNVTAMTQGLNAIDSATEGLRDFTRTVAQTARTFGTTYEQSKILRGEIADLSASMENAQDYFTFSEMRDAAINMMSLGVEAKYLDDEITTLTGSFNLVHGALLMSNATGESASQVFSDIRKSIYDFGMTADEAVTQIGSFYDVASKTGLTMSTVSSALENAASSFKLFGASADLAKPFLEGFVDTLEKVGLGIGNATGLAQSMSTAIMGLASDYGKAFFTFQQGGLDFGAGSGVLGGAIGMRARLLEAEKAGGDQSEIGMEVARAMRQTLRNFGGGEIITLQEAADSPEKQQQFAIQQDLLKTFGISDTAKADRTLELLKNLDDVSVLGKDETKARLEELVDSTREAKDENLEESQKTNAHLSKLIAQNTVASATYTGMLESLKSISIATGGMTRAQIMDMSDAIESAKETVDVNSDSAAKNMLREISQSISDMGNESRADGLGSQQIMQSVNVAVSMDDQTSSFLKTVVEIAETLMNEDTIPR